MHRDSIIKDLHNKVTTFEWKISFLLSFKGIDDFPDVENNKDTVQTQGNDKDSHQLHRREVVHCLMILLDRHYFLLQVLMQHQINI